MASHPDAGFTHPQAQREIQLGEHRVAYVLRRARRRSIGFVVSAEGLTVSAPRWVGQAAVDDALREKAPWILRKYFTLLIFGIIGISLLPMVIGAVKAKMSTVRA